MITRPSPARLPNWRGCARPDESHCLAPAARTSVLAPMSQLTFRTSQCARHRHPEFTVILRNGAFMPGLERVLLDYFEGRVAEGVKFMPEQLVQLGWARLKLVKRADGTLGV